MKKKITIKELRKKLQDKGHGRFYSDWTEIIPRSVSIYLTKGFIRIGASANQITALSILFGIAAVIFLAFGRPLFVAVAAFLYFFVPVLDCSDGEVSRYRGTGSATGEYFDRMAGAIIDPLILFSVGIAVFRYTGNLLDIIAGFIGGFSLVLMRLSIAYIYACAFSDKKENNEKSVKKNIKIEEIVDIPQVAKKVSIIGFIGDLFFIKTWGLIFWIWFAGIISFFSLIFTVHTYIREILQPLIWLYAIITPFSVIYIIFKTMKNKTPDKLK